MENHEGKKSKNSQFITTFLLVSFVQKSKYAT